MEDRALFDDEALRHEGPPRARRGSEAQGLGPDLAFELPLDLDRLRLHDCLYVARAAGSELPGQAQLAFEMPEHVEVLPGYGAGDVEVGAEGGLAPTRRGWDIGSGSWDAHGASFAACERHF